MAKRRAGSVGLKTNVAPEQLSRRIRASGAMGCSAGNVNFDGTPREVFGETWKNKP
jgi:hypothetical protein